MDEIFDNLADHLDEVLTDYKTWLADALRRGQDVSQDLRQLIDVCQQGLDALDEKLTRPLNREM